jgi:zinc transporter
MSAEFARPVSAVPAAPPPGFVCAFRIIDGRPCALTWQQLQQLSPNADDPVWLHLNGSDTHIVQWLCDYGPVPESGCAFLTGNDTRPRLHIGTQSLYGVIAEVELAGKGEPDDDPRRHARGALRFYVDRQRMITVRVRPLRSTDRLRHALSEGEVFNDTIEMFAELVRELNETLADKVDDLAESVDDIEEAVLEGRHVQVRAALGKVRRDLVEVKRYVDPERNALVQLVTRRMEWADVRSMESLVQAVQALNGLGAALESLYERAKVLQEEMGALLAEDINRRLLVLSVMTALMMPASLVSGIFGMNVAGLPGTHSRDAFWIVIVLMAALAALTLSLMKRMRVW